MRFIHPDGRVYRRVVIMGCRVKIERLSTMGCPPQMRWGSVSEPADGRENCAPTESRQINSHQAFKSPDSLEFGSGVAFHPNSGELREV